MCDGTFKTAPSTSDNKHFYQNLILYAKYGDHVLPFMKAIMTGKCRPLYDKTFQKMKEHLPSSVNPETVMSDYEQALQGALSDIFPDANVLGCWFHFSQCVFKHMMHFGLIICYREKEDFALWLQLTMAMPLLPQNRIEEAWAQLKIFPVDVGHGYKGKFRQLKTYIEKTWVIQRLDVLSVFGSDVRTNNAVESWK